MMTEKEMADRIAQLETRKNELIENIKNLNRRVRYKIYAQKALEPFLEQTKDVAVVPIRKRKKALEFQIATQAYTPKIEKELLKQMKKIDDELNKVREVEKARRKKRFIEEDIKEAEAQVTTIEEELKKIREELKVLYGDMKTVKSASKRGIKLGGFEDSMVTLGDMVVIEDNTKS
ncbi:hypothetical protein HZC08_02085 [Candidatus Micrarchaeota archaeon]|nr:hypothetical protein [Candidatus Micrarchaeota archaeon]